METTQATSYDSPIIHKGTSPKELLYRKKLFRAYTFVEATPITSKENVVTLVQSVTMSDKNPFEHLLKAAVEHPKVSTMTVTEPKVWTSDLESEEPLSDNEESHVEEEEDVTPKEEFDEDQQYEEVKKGHRTTKSNKKRKRIQTRESSDDEAYEPPAKQSRTKKKTSSKKKKSPVEKQSPTRSYDDEENESPDGSNYSRGKGRGRGRGRNSSMPGITCHQCKQKTLETKSSCKHCYLRYNAHKGKKDVDHPIADWESYSSHFCATCLKNRYGQDVDFTSAALSEEWKCPICEGICNCSSCRRRANKVPYSVTTREALKKGYSNVNEMLIEEGMER